MSRVERIDGPHDNTPHDEANCPSCQEDIAAMTQPAAAPDVPVRRESLDEVLRTTYGWAKSPIEAKRAFANYAYETVLDQHDAIDIRKGWHPFWAGYQAGMVKP